VTAAELCSAHPAVKPAERRCRDPAGQTEPLPGSVQGAGAQRDGVGAELPRGWFW